MVQPTDMIGPAAQFIANSNPLQGVGRAAQQAGGIANQMSIAPGYQNILGGLGQGPSPVSNANPMQAAMSAMGMMSPGSAQGGNMGSDFYQKPMMYQPQSTVNNAPPMQPASIQPRGAPELYASAGGSQMGQPKPYGQNLFLTLAGMGRGGM